MKTLWTFIKRHPFSFIMICIGIIISIASANILPFILFGVFFGGESMVLEWVARNSYLESKAWKEEMQRRKAAEELKKRVYSQKYE